MKFNIYTTFAEFSHLERKDEILYCLTKNCENHLIDKIYILYESSMPFDFLNEKLTIINVTYRPKFSDLIKLADQHGDANVIKILCNADIFFNETLLSVTKNIGNNDVYALTRWDLKKDGSIKYYSNFKSQDAWIFKSKLGDSIGDFYTGLPGCDNRLAYEFNKLSFRVSNPSITVKAIHVHNTGIRTYNKQIDKISTPYYYPLPSFFPESKNKNNYLIKLDSKIKYINFLKNNELEGFNVSIFQRKFYLYYWKYLKLIRWIIH